MFPLSFNGNPWKIAGTWICRQYGTAVASFGLVDGSESLWDTVDMRFGIWFKALGGRGRNNSAMTLCCHGK